MKAEDGQLILNFLNRVQLSGNEAPAFMRAVEAVQKAVRTSSQQIVEMPPQEEE